MSNYATLIAAQEKLPLPVAPTEAQPLFQERGFRSSRAIPYALNTSAFIDGANISLTFANTGAQGAVFHVYDLLHLDLIPRRYTVEAGKSLPDVWSSTADGGAYNLWVYGPSGFVRSFAGNAPDWASAVFRPEILVGYNPALNQLLLQIRNAGPQAGSLTLTPNNEFVGTAVKTIAVPAKGTIEVELSLAASANWYDFTASTANFERRFAGRMETGQDGISDPAIAASL
jgi:phospholipase C